MRSRNICDQFFQNKRNFCIFYFFHQFIIILSRFSEICQLRSKKNSEFANFERNDKINIFNDFLQRKNVEFRDYYDYFLFFFIFATFFIFTLCSDFFDTFFIETDFQFFARIDFECDMIFFFFSICLFRIFFIIFLFFFDSFFFEI